MRSLALARYRFLTIIRRLKWVFPVMVIAIVMPGVLENAIIVVSEDFRENANMMLAEAAVIISFVYVIHVGALVMLCASFGVVPPRPPSARPSDLMETIPVRGQARFWGDALGIFFATVAIHACALPLLAIIFATTPFPTSLFWALEAMLALLLLLVSTSASLSLRREPKSWTEVSAKGWFLMMLCLVLVIAGTTRVDEFPDAMAAFFSQPSPPAWHAVVITIDRLPLLIVLSLALYGGFMAWHSIASTRMIERA